MEKNIFTVGIDIGGTYTDLGIVNNRGHCLSKLSILMVDQNNIEEFIVKMVSSIKDLCHELPSDFSLGGIGVAAPAARHHEGIIRDPANLQWGTVDIVNLLKQYYDVPIAITNDSNAAALGEMIYGRAKGMRNFIVLTLGTGLGAGIVVEGKILYGQNSLAGELGHIIVELNGRVCGCGRRGCAETYVSASGLCRTVVELLAHNTNKTEMRKISVDQLTALKIYELALLDDSLARQAFDTTGKYLGLLIANTVAAFDPEAVIISGGLSNAGNVLLDPTRKSYDDNILNLHKGNVAILKSQLNNAAILGASYLVSEMMQRQNEKSLESYATIQK